MTRDHQEDNRTFRNINKDKKGGEEEQEKNK
jgi:hypothetical protein